MLRLRPVEHSDREAVLAVEAAATPGLRYLPDVFEMFVTDERGEFFLAEEDGEIVACAKFTAVPDNTAWLETLRVLPAYQGRGIGKQLYQRYAEIASAQAISTMRMYTGIRNLVSRGLAEYSGFELEASFLGYSKKMDGMHSQTEIGHFQQICDPHQATKLIMAHAAEWNHFLVMNRTFYKLTPELCHPLAAQGFVYADAVSQSLLVLGARFSPQQARHIGMWAGDALRCLHFAEQQTRTSHVRELCCLFPDTATAQQEMLVQQGYQQHASSYIVMRKG